jgi:catechol 2,3-dioxygenase-like lactoylglutathione lyase family enzyme
MHTIAYSRDLDQALRIFEGRFGVELISRTLTFFRARRAHFAHADLLSRTQLASARATALFGFEISVTQAITEQLGHGAAHGPVHHDLGSNRPRIESCRDHERDRF